MRAARLTVTGTAAALCVAIALAGCGGGGSKQSTSAPPAPRPATGAPPWPAPSDPLQRARAVGLVPEPKEFLFYHVHAHLDVFVNGSPVRVPAGIGIDITDPAVNRGPAPDGTTAYGGIKLCLEPCISPLHTHDDSGVLHTESKESTPNRLGQFFHEWGVRLDGSCVGGFCRPTASIAVYVDGKPFEGNPASIELTDGKEIAIVIGTPPQEIPSGFPS